MGVLDILKRDDNNVEDVIERALDSGNEIIIEKFHKAYILPTNFCALPTPSVKLGYRLITEDNEGKISAEKTVTTSPVSKYDRTEVNQYVRKLETRLENENIDYEVI